MNEEYNHAIANHYSAYRPPLHKIILANVLSKNDTFQNGLDIGSGTGYSSIALTPYCRHIYGVEPSPSMRNEATPHHQVTYLEGSGEALPISDHIINIVTFAGSLYYAKSTTLIKELQRVCQKQAEIVCYDFEVILDNALEQFGIEQEAIESDYDHEINLSDCSEFEEIIVKKQSITFNVTAKEIAHILLSDSFRYKEFIKAMNVSDPYLLLVERYKNEKNELEAMTYFSKYQIK